MRNQKGFTLIELVVVIVILGILAAVAVPKFIDIQVDAKQSAVNGMLGAVTGAANLAHAQALINGATGANGTIDMEGTTIDLVYGWPASTDTGSNENISGAINLQGFTYAAGATGTFDLIKDAGTDDCYVEYIAPTNSGDGPTYNIAEICD